MMRNACLFATLSLALALPAGLVAEDKANKTKPKPVDYAANLKKVPVSDPTAETRVELVKDVIGVHPRLLFTLKEIEALKESAATDTLLKEAIDDTIATAGQFPLESGTPAWIKEDTPAIWKSGGTYTGLAYAWHLNKDPAIKAKIIAILTTMLREPHWADTADLDSNMGAANNMMMTGVLFDAICTELEPDFRAKLAAKMLTHVRRLFYLGHKMGAVGTIKYWQNDPANNHRWHRNAGFAACLLAIADEPGLDVGFMLEQFRKEMDFIMKWQPVDGDCHEGAGYQSFGLMYLGLATRMSDRVLGTGFQKHTALRNSWTQRIYYQAPGRFGNFSFGDDSNGNGANFERLDAAFFLGPHLSRDPVAQAALVNHLESMRKGKAEQAKAKPKDDKKPNQGELSMPWTMLVFYDPTITGGDHLTLPTYRLFPDLGAVSLRDSWKDDAVGLAFKCGPYGGYKLNEFAWHTGKQTYINVAHDDPDANSFSLVKAGAFIFHPGSYSMPKMTETNSTVLVDGKGQINEGSHYTQPVKDTDMRTLSYLTGWKVGDAGRIIIEGETGKAYPDRLSRFRRSLVWLPGDYVLILDDLVATKQRTIDWIGVTEKGTVEAPAADAAATWKATASSTSGTTVELQLVADVPVKGSIKAVKMEGRYGDVDLDQVRFTAEADKVHFACVIDPWGRKPAVVIANEIDVMKVMVTIDGTTDTWTWRGATDDKLPSTIEGSRGGKPLIALGEKDLAPHGE